jgi:hypothetical protein
MKKSILSAFLFLLIATVKAQSSMIVLRNELVPANIYDSAKKQVIGTISANTYFYGVDTLIGNWYALPDIPRFQRFVRKSDVAIFDSLPVAKQRNTLNKVFTKFYTVCGTANDSTKNDSSYIPQWYGYYDSCFAPMLTAFSGYYERTKDTVTLMHLFKAKKCNPDGDFAEGFDFAMAHAYMADKKLFVHQLLKITNKDLRSGIEKSVESGLLMNYATFVTGKKTDTELFQLSIMERDRFITLIHAMSGGK